jgi:hypothetical protein
VFEQSKETEALRELRRRLSPVQGEQTDLAVEGLVRYMAIVVKIYEAIEANPKRLAELQALTTPEPESTMTAERSITNQYSKP